MAVVVTGGFAVQPDDQGQPDADALIRTTSQVITPPPITPSREPQSAVVDQQRVTLGSGELLEAVIEKTVKQMDPAMNSHQVVAAVAVLMDDVHNEAPNANLQTLSPGVSVVIVRKRSPNGMIWDAIVGKYSGMT